jgi:hypothetical protein
MFAGVQPKKLDPFSDLRAVHFNYDQPKVLSAESPTSVTDFSLPPRKGVERITCAIPTESWRKSVAR